MTHKRDKPGLKRDLGINLDPHHRLIRVFQGQELSIARDKILRPYDFKSGQNSEGRIVFGCNGLDFVFNGKDYIHKIVAYTDDCQRVSLNNLRRISRSFTTFGDKPSGTVVFIAAEMELRNIVIPFRPAKVVFHLSNLEFFSLSWSLDEFQIRIRKVPQYQEKTDEIKATGKANITAEMHVESASRDGILIVERAAEVATDICSLLSIAKGCRVQWLFYEVFTAEGILLASYHVYRMPAPYSFTDLIADNTARELEEFIEIVYPNYCKLKIGEAWKIEQIVDHYVDTIARSGFLELQALKLAVLIDFISGRYATSQRTEHYIKPELFKKKTHEMMRQLKQLFGSLFTVASLQIEKNDLNAVISSMARKIGEFNRPDFDSTLREFLTSLHLRVDEKKRRRFVRIRNALVHEARFIKKGESLGAEANELDEMGQYHEVQSLADLLLLGLLGYDQYYYDLYLEKKVRMPVLDY